MVLGRDCGEYTGTVQQHRQLAKIDANTVCQLTAELASAAQIAVPDTRGTCLRLQIFP